MMRAHAGGLLIQTDNNPNASNTAVPVFKPGDLVTYATEIGSGQPTTGSELNKNDGTFNVYYTPAIPQILYNNNNLLPKKSDGLGNYSAADEFPVDGQFQIIGVLSGRVGSQDMGDVNQEGAGAWYDREEPAIQTDAIVFLMVCVDETAGA